MRITINTDISRRWEIPLGNMSHEEEEPQAQKEVHLEELRQDEGHLLGGADDNPMHHGDEPRSCEQREDERAKGAVFAEGRDDGGSDGEEGEEGDGGHVGEADARVEVEAKVEAREVEGEDDGEHAEQVQHEQAAVRALVDAAEEVENGAAEEGEDGAERGQRDDGAVQRVREGARHRVVELQVVDEQCAVKRSHDVRPHVERLVVQRE